MKKKYTLKPGRHQFAPGSPALHTNDNLTDDEAEWYLKKYPHIASLFLENQEEEDCTKSEPDTAIGSIKPKKQSTKSPGRQDR
jgi:hypothetical protein